MAQLWSVVNDTVLSITEERITQEIQLPLAETNATITHISGQLPVGMRVTGTKISGTPDEVIRETNYRFVLRASYNGQIEDRTFTIRVLGADDPNWITPAGQLAIGSNGLLFVLDNVPLEFQLLAEDADLPAGDELEFFVKSGTLPPGLQLTRDGRIVGVVEPLIASELLAGDGGYDTTLYGKLPLDFGVTIHSDLNQVIEMLPEDILRAHKTLNRYYYFTVSVTDGDSTTTREFTIYVVSDDFLRADNVIVKSANQMFTADNTHNRNPIWITPKNLGYKRANNYFTIFLDIVEHSILKGTVVYTLEEFNDDDTPSMLPIGTSLDPVTGEITGRVPYQPAVTEQYKFTVTATRYEGDINYAVITATMYEDTLAGKYTFKVYKIPTGTDDGVDDINMLRGSDINLYGTQYIISSIDDTHDEYDIIQLSSTLQPTLTLNVEKFETTTLKNYFYTVRNTYNDQLEWKNRKLIYSDTEIYTVTNVIPYVEWYIYTKDGSDLSVVYPETAPTYIDTPRELFEYLTGYPVTIIEETADKLKIRIAETATTNLSALQQKFTSTSEIVYELTNSRLDRVFLDTTMTRDIQNSKVGLGILAGDALEKYITVDTIDEVQMPKSTRTFTLNVLGEVESTISWLTEDQSDGQTITCALQKYIQQTYDLYTGELQLVSPWSQVAEFATVYVPPPGLEATINVVYPVTVEVESSIFIIPESADPEEIGVHVATNWQVATDPDFGPETIVFESYGDTDNLTTLSLPDFPFEPTYYVRVQYITDTGAKTGWSDPEPFRIADEFEFAFDADYIVMTYTFTTGDDLDTRTAITSPIATSYVGWGFGYAVSPYLYHAGDNTGLGDESAYIDVNSLRNAYPNSYNIQVDTRAQWYGTLSTTPITMEITLYKGGTMVDNGYTWINPTAEDSKQIAFASKVIDLYSRSSSSIGQRVGVLNYNVLTGTGFYDISG